MAGQRVINVRPMGAETNAPSKIFQLSDLDHLMPKLYVHMIEIFELPQDFSKDSIVESLVTGLERILVDYPILSGQSSARHYSAQRLIGVNRNSTL